MWCLLLWRLQCYVVSLSTRGLSFTVWTTTTDDHPLSAAHRSAVASTLLAATTAHSASAWTHLCRHQSVAVRLLLPPRRTACTAATSAIADRSLSRLGEWPADVVPTRTDGTGGLRRPRNQKDKSRLHCSCLPHRSLINASTMRQCVREFHRITTTEWLTKVFSVSLTSYCRFCQVQT